MRCSPNPRWPSVTLMMVFFCAVVLMTSCVEAEKRKHYRMCKNVRMNTRTSVCCRGVVFIRQNRHQIYSCCDGLGYDSALFTCCGQSIVARCATRSGIYSDHCRQSIAKRPPSAATTKCCTTEETRTDVELAKSRRQKKEVGVSKRAVQCCHVDESCCGGSRGLFAGGTNKWSSYANLPGIDCCSPGLSKHRKAACCAGTAEKFGALPKCCNKIRPYCCGEGKSMQCCVRKPRRTCCLNKQAKGRTSTSYHSVYSTASRHRAGTRATNSYSHRRRSSTSSSYDKQPYISSSAGKSSNFNRRPSTSVTSTYTSYKRRRPSAYRRRPYATSGPTNYKSSFYGGYSARKTAILNRNGHTGTLFTSGRAKPVTPTTLTPENAKTHATPKTTTLVIDRKNIRFTPLKPVCKLRFKPYCCYGNYAYQPSCCRRPKEWCNCCGRKTTPATTTTTTTAPPSTKSLSIIDDSKSCCPKPDFARQRCCSSTRCYYCCMPKPGTYAPKPTRRWYDCTQPKGAYVYKGRIQHFSCCDRSLKMRSACCARGIQINGRRARCCNNRKIRNYYSPVPSRKISKPADSSGSMMCGSWRYSTKYNLCCQGKRISKLNVYYKCCGGSAYDSLTKRCCHGNMVKSSC